MQRSPINTAFIVFAAVYAIGGLAIIVWSIATGNHNLWPH